MRRCQMRRFTILVILVFLSATAQAGKMVKVKVQKSTIFQQPHFFAKVVTSVEYGDQLEILDELKDWVQVKFREGEGWIHKSSLTSGKFNLGTIFVGTSSPSATHDEVAIAGKGFTPEVERGYKDGHPEMNYALVDEIERYDVDDDSLHDFIRRGGLKIEEAKP
jgi:hypothetical protein